MADEAFKLPGSSYTEIAKIIRAYGHAQDEASLEDVASRAAVDKTFVSRNNGFLVCVGILIGGKRKSLTPAGRALAQALDHEMIDQIQAEWQELVDENDFLKRIVSAVRIRNGMDPVQLRAHIAYTAGVPRKPITMTGASAVIDVLRQSGHLVEQDGKVVATRPRVSAASILRSGSGQSDISEVAANSSPQCSTASDAPIVHSLRSSAGLAVSLRININCDAGELEGVRQGLLELISELRQIDDDPLN